MSGLPIQLLTPLSIPSPATGVWELGPVPLRGYALAILLGVVLGIWLSERRWQARGGRGGEISDIAVWAIPFGLVGGRLYHVATDWQLYFGEGRDPVTALYVWNGGLGIWGAVSLGAVGALIGARRAGIRVSPLMDVLAPGVLLGQAIGRWGNWFNSELYGRPTDLPWGLEIDPASWPPGQTFAEGTTFHPTFLYESLWSLLGVVVLLWLDRRFDMGRGRLAVSYVMLYTAGRFGNELLRIDDVQLDDVGGLRLNAWVSVVVFALAAAYLAWTLRVGTGSVPGPGGRRGVGVDAGERPVGAVVYTADRREREERHQDEDEDAGGPDVSGRPTAP